MAKGEKTNPSFPKKVILGFKGMWAKAQEEKQEKSQQFFRKDVQASRKRKKRVIAFSLLFLLLVSLVYNVAFAQRYKAIQRQVNASEQKVSNALIEKQKGDLLLQNVAVIYTKRFLEQYVNIPKEEAGREKRLKGLSQYFVKGYDLGKLEDLEGFKGYRKLHDVEYLRTERISNKVAKVHFNVQYDVVSIQTTEQTVKKKVKDPKTKKDKEVEEKVQKEQEVKNPYSMEMSVPITTDGKVFAVVENPNLIKSSFVGSIDFEEEQASLRDDITDAQEQDITSFTEQFLEAYATNDESLQLISNVDEGLGNQEFMDIVSLTAKKLDGSQYEVKVMSTFKDKGSELQNVYGFTLVLNQANDKYTVESIK